MVSLYTGTVPNLTQSQPDFDTNTQSILDYIASLAPELNAWVGAYVQDTSSASSTSNSVGTGSKTFTVESGKGYKVNMTVRASATSGNYMDGIVTAYSGTSLTVNFTAATGSGTFTSWQIFLSIPGSNVTLGSNTFTGDQIVPDEAYDPTGWNGDLSVPTKNAVRDKIEDILLSKTGTIFDWPGTTAPAGAMALPLVPTNVSRTTYADLFSAIGTTWGAGDGSTTFGLPFVRAGYATIAADGNVGSETVGQVISHSHVQQNSARDQDTGGGGTGPNTVGSGNNMGLVTSNQSTLATGGSANYAAGTRMLKCIWL